MCEGLDFSHCVPSVKIPPPVLVSSVSSLSALSLLISMMFYPWQSFSRDTGPIWGPCLTLHVGLFMSSVVERRLTGTHGEFDRRAVRRLPFMNWQWISFSSLSWAELAGQNEFTLHVRLLAFCTTITGPWQSPITAASSSRNLWPPTPSLWAGTAR